MQIDNRLFKTVFEDVTSKLNAGTHSIDSFHAEIKGQIDIYSPMRVAAMSYAIAQYQSKQDFYQSKYGNI